MEKRYVVLHTPGPNWQKSIDPREQPGIEEHIKHYQKFHEQGKLSHGGPFLDLDSGGMMIAKEFVTRNELDDFASADPAVKNGLLSYTIKTWYIAMKRE